MARVLLIDDNASLRQTIGLYLQNAGYIVIQAEDGTSGLRLAAENPADAVLLDADMPGMSGIDVCKAIKCDPVLSHLPVVIMTGGATREVAAMAKAAGAAVVLAKPFGLALLLATLTRILTPTVAS